MTHFDQVLSRLTHGQGVQSFGCWKSTSINSRTRCQAEGSRVKWELLKIEEVEKVKQVMTMTMHGWMLKEEITRTDGSRKLPWIWTALFPMSHPLPVQSVGRMQAQKAKKRCSPCS